MSYASWLSTNGYPGYSENFAKKVYKRMLITGEPLAFVVELVSNWN